VISILSLALFLRLYNLSDLSLWDDEPYHLYVSQSIIEDGSFDLPSGHAYARAKPFAYLTALSAKIMGVNEFGIRFPTALFGFLCLVLFFILTKKLLGNSVAVVTLLLLTVLPLEIGWARVTRFYTLFQFFTILVWYTFFMGFLNKNSFIKKSKSKSKFSIKEMIADWEINWFYILLFIIVLLVAISIQIIGVFLLVSLILTIVVFGIYVFFKTDIATFLKSKYFIFVAAAIIISVVTVLIFPKIRDMIEYGVSYIPAFAKNPSAQDRMKYIKFIMGKDVFPIGAMFVLGAIQALFRLNKVVIYSALFFIVQVFLFSFVFAYRANQYIYNVIPFFILVAGYGIVNIINQEKLKLKESRNFIHQFLSKYFKEPAKVVSLLFIVILIAMPFFLEGVTIPFNKPGASNGAVTFEEWNEATEYVKNNKINSAKILTTHPLIVKYYLGKVDYNLNLTEIEVAKINATMDSSGKYYDFYSGTQFINSAALLDSLVKTTPDGYIIVNTFCLIQPQYISEEIKQYIGDNLTEAYLSPYGTVRVYSWNNGKRSPGVSEDKTKKSKR